MQALKYTYIVELSRENSKHGEGVKACCLFLLPSCKQTWKSRQRGSNRYFASHSTASVSGKGASLDCIENEGGRRHRLGCGSDGLDKKANGKSRPSGCGRCFKVTGSIWATRLEIRSASIFHFFLSCISDSFVKDQALSGLRTPVPDASTCQPCQALIQPNFSNMHP